MRTAPPAVVAFLAANDVATRADLFTLTLLNGVVYRWTTADRSIAIAGATYYASGKNAPQAQRSGYGFRTFKAGIDTLDLTLVGGNFTMGGKQLSAFALAGGFDGARLQVDHVVGSDLANAVANGPILSLFEGPVGDVEPQGGSKVVLHCNSEPIKLNVLLPRFVLAPSCGNVVYDANCGLSRAAFTVVGAASGVPTRKTVATASAAVTANGAGYYNLGVLRFTSGANLGTARAVESWDGSVFTFALPLPTAPAAGDTFTVYPGCDRTRARCVSPFNNLPNYRGYPHIPSTESGA